MKLEVTIILLMLTSVLADKKKCEMTDACSCQFGDGSVIDITSLGNQDNTPRFKDVLATTEQNHYSYNPCFPFDETKDCKQAATCILNPDLSQAVQIGDAAKTGFKYDPGLDNVVVSYTSGGIENMKISEVILECDESACDPAFTANGQQEDGQFRMTLKSVCACPNGCDSSGPKSCSGNKGRTVGGVTIGGLICILFFSILIVYFIVGAVVMKFMKKAEGKEIIPNFTFWKAVPVLVKDGVMFSLSKVSPRFSKSTYEDI